MFINLDDVTIYRRVNEWGKGYKYVELTSADFSNEEGDFPVTEDLPFDSELVFATSSQRESAEYFPMTSAELIELVTSFNCKIFGKPSMRNSIYSMGSRVTDFVACQYLESVRFATGFKVGIDESDIKFRGYKKLKVV